MDINDEIEMQDLKYKVRDLQERNEELQVEIDILKEQFSLTEVVKSLPTEECVREWYREGDIDDNFWKHSTEWSNEDVFKEVYKALKYFIKRWQ